MTTDPECVTCGFDDDTDTCQWASIRRNCDKSISGRVCSKEIYVVRCNGPEYPRSYMTSDFNTWTTMESNQELEKSHKETNLQRTRVIFGVWHNTELDTYHNYEMWVPADFDENTMIKQYPIFLEVYAGPEFQKVQGVWRSAWRQSHFPAAYDCITCENSFCSILYTVGFQLMGHFSQNLGHISI